MARRPISLQEFDAAYRAQAPAEWVAARDVRMAEDVERRKQRQVRSNRAKPALTREQDRE